MHAHRVFTGDSVHDMRVCGHHFGIINDCQDLFKQHLAYSLSHIVAIDENIGGALSVNLGHQYLYPQIPETPAFCCTVIKDEQLLS